MTIKELVELAYKLAEEAEIKSDRKDIEAEQVLIGAFEKKIKELFRN